MQHVTQRTHRVLACDATKLVQRDSLEHATVRGPHFAFTTHDGLLDDAFRDTEHAQGPNSIGCEQEAGADFAKFRAALEHDWPIARALERKRTCEPTNSRTDH
jgi:hypothetical protein